MIEVDDDWRVHPERIDTLLAQRDALLRGVRYVQMFPNGTHVLARPVGFRELLLPRGTFHFNDAHITEEQIRARSTLRRENEFLLLGPYNKGDVMACVMEGDRLSALSEYNRHRVLVRCAWVAERNIKEVTDYFRATVDSGGLVEVLELDRVISERFSHARL